MSASQLTLHSAVSTTAFQDSIGVNTHLDFTTSAYTNLGAVEAALAYLDIDHVRDGFGSPTSAPLFQTLALQGVKFDFVLLPSLPIATQLSLIEANASIADLIEGPNESDIWTGSYNGLTGLDATAAMQQDVYNFVQSSAALAGTPVLQASMAHTASFAQVGDLSAYSNYANIHAYFGTGNPPGPSLPVLLAQAQLISPGQPAIASEGGYYTLADTTDGISQLAQAKDILNLLFDDWNAGISRTYLYELADENPDPNSNTPNLHYGLYNTDWTPKPAAIALHNLTSLLAGTGSTPIGSLAYQVSGLPGTGQQLLLERADGSFVITVWNDARNWNPATMTDIPDAGVPVSLDLEQSYQTISIYDPLVSATVPIAIYTDTRHVDLTLLDHPVLIVLSPELAPVQSLTSVVTNTVAEGTSLGNLWSQIIAAGQLVDPGRTLTITSVTLTSTRGYVVFDAIDQSLTYLANGYDSKAAIDSFSYVLTDSFGETVAGLYNVTITGPTMPTVLSTVAGATVYASAAGMRLISEASGQKLNGSAAGGDLFFAGPDTVVAAYGLGNTIIAAPGNHAHIATGAGGATVRMGDGNQTVVAPGAGNTITLGTGNSSVSATGGNEVVTIAGGNNTVYVTGGSNRVTTGSGADTITALGGGALINAGDGDNTITVSLTGNTIVTGSGNDVITGSAGASTIDAGAGNDIIRFGGSGSTIIGGLGDDQIYDSGTNNTIVLNGAGEGTDQIYGNIPTNGEMYDLRTALAATAWTGTAATIGSFLQVTTTSGNTTVWINPTGVAGAPSYAVAVLHATGTMTLASFLQRSDLSLTASPEVSVAEGQSLPDLWSTLMAVAQQADPWHLGTYTITSIDTTGMSGYAQLDAAGQTLTYEASGYNAAAPTDSFGFVLTDGLGRTITGRLTLDINGPAMPTVTSSVAGATVRATAAGMRLISGAAGQWLVGSTAGNTTVFAGTDGRVLLYSYGNTVYVLPGSHSIIGGKGDATIILGAGDSTVNIAGTGNSITAGDGNYKISAGGGNATITLGDGDNTVTVSGANNVIQVGSGQNTISAGSGNQSITVAGGPSTITLGGAGNTVTTGAGDTTINAKGSASTFTTGSGNDVLRISGSGNTITTGDGDDTVIAFGGGNWISTGAGDDVIRFAGSGSVIDAGPGNDMLYDSGSNNTLVLNAAGKGIDQIFGYVLTNGDLLDLRPAMAQTAWTGSAATAGQFLSVRSDGINATISMNNTGVAGAPTSDIAVLHGTGNVTLAGLLPHVLLT